MNAPYDRSYYELQVDGSLRSARTVVPIVLGMLHVRSVVDFGCGVGAWLRAFVENGIEDVRGYDGEYVDRSALLIAPDRFVGTDLAAPIETGRRFDLAMSVEVAEHLPESSARGFVRSLTQAAPVVLFGAAIPGQSGVKHINCRWPGYWAQRFAEFGFRQFDPIRPRIVDDRNVENWYRFNTFVYVDQRVDTSPALCRRRRPSVRFSRVHGVLLDYMALRAVVRGWSTSAFGESPR